MPDSSKAVFLSYASQDAEAARNICDALRRAGIEVWFDQSELRGGDAWDAKIRRQIKDCALFVPIISATTQARSEGYFRLEWLLAVERSRLIADHVAFLVPVVIDDTGDAAAFVPEKFRDVQWMRLPQGQSTVAFCDRVRQLLSAPIPSTSYTAPTLGQPSGARRNSLRRWLTPAIAAGLAALGVAVWSPWRRASPSLAAMPTPAPSPTESQRLVQQARDILIKTELGLSELDAGAVLCQKAVGLDSADVEAWAAFSEIESWRYYAGADRTQERLESARTKAARAMNLAPRSFWARRAHATYLVCLVDYVTRQPANEAESLLQELRREQPRDRQTLLLVGLILFRVDRLDEAIAAFDELARLPGAAARAFNEQAWTLMRARRFTEADAAVDRSIAAEPFTGNVALKVFLAQAWHGDLQLAEDTLEKLSSVSRMDDRALATAIRVYRWKREPKRILELLKAVPREWISWGINGPKAAVIGDALEMSNRPDAAAVEWRRALTLVEQRRASMSSDRGLILWKAYLQDALGDRTGAADTMKLASQLPGGFFPMLMAYNQSPRLRTAEETMADLERNASNLDRAELLGSLRFNPSFDHVRELPQFQALVTRLETDGRFSAKRAAKSTNPTLAAVADKSVAVLAFANLSDDKTNEYFSDGISEELLNVLAKVPGLRVAARTSAFYFKGKNATAQEIGQKLGVAHLVDGSVRKAGTKVRIAARLSKAETGEQLWSESYEDELKDVFALQDKIARDIADNLKLKLGAATPVAKSVNPEAHRLYLEGRHFWNQRSEEGFVRAETALKKAVAVDPRFARAHAALADLFAIRAWYSAESGLAQAPAQLEQAELAARKALELDPTIAEVHATFGAIHLVSGRLRDAEQAMDRCLAETPNYATARNWRGEVMYRTGRLDLAVDEFVAAARLDPLSPIMLFDCARVLVDALRPEAALEYADRATALVPDAIQANVARARALLALRRPREAVAAIRAVGWNDHLQRGRKAAAVHVLRQSDESADAVTLAESALRTEASDSFIRGSILASLGRADETFPLLAHTPPASVSGLFWNEFIDPIRGDPRFEELMVKLGYAQEYKVARETLARMRREKEAGK